MVKESIPNTNMEMQRALKSHESWAGSFIESVIQEKQPTWLCLTNTMLQRHRENITKPAVAG